MYTAQSQKFSHLAGKTARQGVPRLKRTQRRHAKNIPKDGEAGKGGGSRQREQKCEKFRGNVEPSTGRGEGTEKAPTRWATRSQLCNTKMQVPKLQAVSLPELYTPDSSLSGPICANP